jgi:hypothetical protein
MKTTASTRPASARNKEVSDRSTASFGLFDTVPEDYFHFGQGSSFDAKKTATFLGLKNADVGRISSVSTASVRWDNNIPEAVRTRLEEIAITINLVAKQFHGDVEKTVIWFQARNPLLGDVSPKDMIRLGRFDRLRRFIIQAMVDQNQDR